MCNFLRKERTLIPVTLRRFIACILLTASNPEAKY